MVLVLIIKSNFWQFELFLNLNDDQLIVYIDSNHIIFKI